MGLAGQDAPLRGCSPVSDPNPCPPSGFLARAPSFVQTVLPSPHAGSSLWRTNRAGTQQPACGSVTSTLPPGTEAGLLQTPLAPFSAFPSHLHFLRAYPSHLPSPQTGGSSSSPSPLLPSTRTSVSPQLFSSSFGCPPYRQNGTLAALGATFVGSEVTSFLSTDAPTASVNHAVSPHGAAQASASLLSAGHPDRRIHPLLPVSVSPSVSSQSPSASVWRAEPPQQAGSPGNPDNVARDAVLRGPGTEGGTRAAASSRTARLKASPALPPDACALRQRQQSDGFRPPAQISSPCTNADVAGGRGGSRRRGRKPGRPLPKNLPSNESGASSSGSRPLQTGAVSTVGSGSDSIVARRQPDVVENDDSSCSGTLEQSVTGGIADSERTEEKRARGLGLTGVRWHRIVSGSSSEPLIGGAAEATARGLSATPSRNGGLATPGHLLEFSGEGAEDHSSGGERKRLKRGREDLVMLPVWVAEAVAQEVRRQLRGIQGRLGRTSTMSPDGPAGGRESGFEDAECSPTCFRDGGGAEEMRQRAFPSVTAGRMRWESTLEEGRVGRDGKTAKCVSATSSAGDQELQARGGDGEEESRPEAVEGRWGRMTSTSQAEVDSAGDGGLASPARRGSFLDVQVDWQRAARASTGLGAAGLCEEAFRAYTGHADFLGEVLTVSRRSCKRKESACRVKSDWSDEHRNTVPGFLHTCPRISG